MKILLVGNYPASPEGPFTGPMRVLYQLSEALAALPETEVTVVTPHRMRAMFHHRKHFAWGRAEVWKVNYVDMCCMFRPECDIVNIHGVSMFNILPLASRRFCGVPVIYTAHGLIAREKDLGYHYPPGMLCAEHRLMMKSDRITTVSENTRDMIKDCYPVDESRISVIENGVDIEAFAPAAYPHSRGMPAFLFAGDLLPVKGLDFLLETLITMKDTPFVLKIAGGMTPYFENLKEAFLPLFESGHIQVLGRLSHDALIGAYAESDFVVLTSRYEQFPQVVLEAMSMGKPVIVSDRLGSRKVIAEGGGGFVVEYGNIEELKARLCHLMEDAGMRRRMGKRARETAMSFSWLRIAGKYRDFYRDVLQSCEAQSPYALRIRGETIM